MWRVLYWLSCNPVWNWATNGTTSTITVYIMSVSFKKTSVWGGVRCVYAVCGWVCVCGVFFFVRPLLLFDISSNSCNKLLYIDSFTSAFWTWTLYKTFQHLLFFFFLIRKHIGILHWSFSLVLKSIVRWWIFLFVICEFPLTVTIFMLPRTEAIFMKFSALIFTKFFPIPHTL